MEDQTMIETQEWELMKKQYDEIIADIDNHVEEMFNSHSEEVKELIAKGYNVHKVYHDSVVAVDGLCMNMIIRVDDMLNDIEELPEKYEGIVATQCKIIEAQFEMQIANAKQRGVKIGKYLDIVKTKKESLKTENLLREGANKIKERVIAISTAGGVTVTTGVATVAAKRVALGVGLAGGLVLNLGIILSASVLLGGVEIYSKIKTKEFEKLQNICDELFKRVEELRLLNIDFINSLVNQNNEIKNCIMQDDLMTKCTGNSRVRKREILRTMLIELQIHLKDIKNTMETHAERVGQISNIELKTLYVNNLMINES